MYLPVENKVGERYSYLLVENKVGGRYLYLPIENKVGGRYLYLLQEVNLVDTIYTYSTVPSNRGKGR